MITLYAFIKEKYALEQFNMYKNAFMFAIKLSIIIKYHYLFLQNTIAEQIAYKAYSPHSTFRSFDRFHRI